MINVFGGSGYIGSRFCKNRSDVIVNSRNDYVPKTENIVYFISTTTNHNVLTDPHKDIDTNLTVLIKVLQNCERFSTINFISSWFVYGDAECPVKEDAVCHPKGFYSITKHTAEQLLISYCSIHNVNYRILRLGNVVGGYDRTSSEKKNVFQHIINRLKTNQPVELYNNGKFVRDYIHVDDVVKAINLIIKHGELNSIYNVGNGMPTSFCSIVEYTKQKVNSRSQILTLTSTPFLENTHVNQNYLDVSKLQALGYVPSYTVYNVIDQILANL